MTELCERLTGCGLPLWRVVVFVRTLHPQIVGRRFVWRPDTGTVVTDGSFDLLDRDVFRNSPMTHVTETGQAFRRRLAVLLHEILAQAADRGSLAELVVQEAPAVIGDHHLEMAVPLE